MENEIEVRYTLAKDRIAEIKEETLVAEPYRTYFRTVARFIGMVHEYEGMQENTTLEFLQKQNAALYEDILPSNYEHSYANPVYAEAQLGEYGKPLSFLYTEIRGMIVYLFEKRVWDETIVMELFLEVYQLFTQQPQPTQESVTQAIYWYCSDYTPEIVAYRIRETLLPEFSFATDLIMTSDLMDLRYLYKFGEYISENELKTAEFLQKSTQDEIDAMASTYTQGYHRGFINAGKPLHLKKTVNIRYVLGFERVVKAAILQFGDMGLQPVIYRAASHSVSKKQQSRIGYHGGIANPQYDYDHRGDAALYLNEEYVSKRLRALQQAYDACKEEANGHAGPAVIEVFGEKPFVPLTVSQAYKLSPAQQELQVHLDNESAQIVNRYIKGDERSFTIIAYPIPEIGDKFQEIFRETVRLNTLDYDLYQKIHQYMILALDQGRSVHIQGTGVNETDLTVALPALQDSATQTNFENCVADVNIPVGEVFTSPQLSGTHGLLHVSFVYLNGLLFENLKIHFSDGMVSDYSCSNFEEEEKNRAYIEENILHHHKTLPLGEFAIGTNTTAYVMAQKYKIHDKLPILISEKTGPHFAVGDTCYSWSEDVPVYNPDGREIVARDNEVSRLRTTDPSKAYMGCHTDITIPFEELGHIRINRPEGGHIMLIEDGKFVLEGTQELNLPFSELAAD
ncbi:MAG: aminopeptidase [Lachnospiraceae bacterium]